MRTGVSAPRALVLICARIICFAKAGLVGGGGVSRVCQVVCHPIAVEFNFQLQISDATKLWSVWDQKLGMKAKTERRIFCYLCYSKIIAKADPER